MTLLMWLHFAEIIGTSGIRVMSFECLTVPEPSTARHHARLVICTSISLNSIVSMNVRGCCCPHAGGHAARGHACCTDAVPPNRGKLSYDSNQT